MRIRHSDGAGLWLINREDGCAQWMLRVTVHGMRREMRLGGYPTVGLADARKLSERLRSLAAAGRDPIKERDIRDTLSLSGTPKLIRHAKR